MTASLGGPEDAPNNLQSDVDAADQAATRLRCRLHIAAITQLQSATISYTELQISAIYMFC